MRYNQHFPPPRRILRWGLILIFPWILYSCMKDGDFRFDKLKDFEWKPDIAAPLVHSNLSLKDIIKDTGNSIIHVNPDLSLNLVYSTGKLISLKAEDLFVIGDQDINTDSVGISFPVVIPGDSTNYVINNSYNFNLPVTDQRIDSLFIKNGRFSIDLESNINHNTEILVTIPNLKKHDGTLFKMLFTTDYVAGQTPLPYTKSINFDLKDYYLSMNNSGGGKNQIRLIYKQTIYGDNNPFFGNYYIKMNDKIKDLKFKSFYGYLGQYDFRLKDTVDISIFNNVFSGNVAFHSIFLDVDVNNSYALPIRLTINEAKAYTPTASVNIQDLPNPIDIAYPNLQQIGQTVQTPGLHDIESQDLAAAIAISPRKIVYDFAAKSNPDNNPDIENFVLDTSKFDVMASVNIPLRGIVQNFVLQDTLGFELKRIDEIQELLLRVFTINNFPLEVITQVYFLDESMNKLDSLFSGPEGIILSGIVDPVSLKVITPTEKASEIVLTSDKIQRIRTCKKIIINARLNTYQQGTTDVKIFQDNNVDVKISTRVKLKIQSQ